jgi:ankyrin repeat protein
MEISTFHIRIAPHHTNIETVNGASHIGITNKALEHDLSVGVSSSALAKIPDLLPSETEMRAMLPVSVIDIQGPTLGETATSILNYFNLIVYLISNEMLEVSEDVLTLLEVALSKRPFLSLLLKKTPTSRAFIQQVSKSAIKLRETKVISTLLEAEIFLDAWTLQPDLPLRLAIEERNTDLTKRLIRSGADLTDDRGCEALSIAADVGNLELVSYLTKIGVNPNPQNTSTCYPALLNATRRGDKEMVELLLNFGADINASSSRYSYPSPLVSAAGNGDSQLVQLLLDCGMHTEDRCLRQQTALGIATYQGHSELARQLLDAGAAVHTPVFNVYYRLAYTYHSALYEAVAEGHRSVVEVLLTHKADPNTRKYHLDHSDATGRTALYTAVTNRNERIVRLLLSAGARVNEMNFNDADLDHKCRKETALHQAVRTSNTGLVQILLNAGAIAFSPFSEVPSQSGSQYQDNFSYNTANLLVQYPNTEIAGLLCTADPSAIFKYGTNFFQSAIQSNDIDLARVLVNAGVDVNGVPVGSFRETALQHAISAGNFELAKVLLNCGANVNAPPGGKHSRTALQSALDRGSIELVQVLLNHGANVNTLLGDSYKSTALQSAVDRGSMELVQVLLSHGADVNAHPSKLSRTALQTAVDGGSMELVQVLLSHGADVNARPSKLSRTALQTAVDGGSMELVQVLLSHGADIHAPGTMEYGTALQLAAQAGHVEVVKLLLHFTKIRDVEANPSRHYLDSDIASNDWKCTMLPAAAKGGLLEIVRLLLTEGADINTVPPGTRYGTALQEAIGQKDLNMIHLLLHYRADPNIPGPVWVSRVWGWRTGTALQTAVDTKSLELIRILVEAGARADVLSGACEDKRTPLEAAIENFEGEDLTVVVRLLLAAGADVNTACIQSEEAGHSRKITMLPAMVQTGNMQLVKVLLEAGADVNAVSTYWDRKNGPTSLKSSLQHAVALADLEMSKILLKAGADVGSDLPFFYSDKSLGISGEAGMLATAILSGNIELFQLLLDSGANVNSSLPDAKSITALQAASDAGHLDIVETLLRRGVEVDGNPNSGLGTALKCAVVNGHAGIAFALLEADADPTLARPGRSGSPLVQAAVDGRIDILQMFLNTIKSRGTSGQLYVELLVSSLEMALERNDGEYNIAIGMIKTEIEDSKST